MSGDQSGEEQRASHVDSDDNLIDAALTTSRIAKKKKIRLPRNSVLFMTLTELMIASNLLTIALYLYLDFPRIIDAVLESPGFREEMKKDEKFQILSDSVFRSKFLGFAPLFTCGIVLTGTSILKLVESFRHGASLWFVIFSNAFVVLITAIVIFGSSFVYHDMRNYPDDTFGSTDPYGNMLIYVTQKLYAYNSTEVPYRIGNVHRRMKCCGFHLPTDYLNSPQLIAMKNPPYELLGFSLLDPGFGLGNWNESSFITVAPRSCCPVEQTKKNNTHCNQIKVDSAENGGFQIVQRANIYDIGCIARFAVTFELQALLVLITSVSLVVICLGDGLYHSFQHMKMAKKVDLLSKYD